MGYVGVSLCDFCGKRTEKFAGHLRLIANIRRKFQGGGGTYSSQSTTRSWSICKRCLNKLSSIETTGDKIKEELELKLDQIRTKNSEIKLLS